MGYPRRVLQQFLHRLSVVAVVPRIDNLVEVGGVAQPAALVYVVAHSRRDELPLVGIVAVDQKLGHGIADGRQLDVLAERPPAVVPHLLELLLRTVEQGHVPCHPLPGLGVGNGMHNVLVLHLVEVVDVVAVVVSLQHGCMAVGIQRVRGNVGDGPRCRLRFRLVGTGHIEVLVGGGVDVGLVEERPCAEHDARDALDGRVELASACLPSVHVVDGTVERR